MGPVKGPGMVDPWRGAGRKCRFGGGRPGGWKAYSVKICLRFASYRKVGLSPFLVRFLLLFGSVQASRRKTVKIIENPPIQPWPGSQTGGPSPKETGQADFAQALAERSAPATTPSNASVQIPAPLSFQPADPLGKIMASAFIQPLGEVERTFGLLERIPGGPGRSHRHFEAGLRTGSGVGTGLDPPAGDGAGPA